MGKNILVLGTIAVDTVLNVDRLPQEDGFAAVLEEKAVAGGSSANVSVALKKLGNAPFQSGRVSDDEFGRTAGDDLIKNGVDSRNVVVRHGGVTLHTYIVVDNKGRHFIIANGGKDRMDIRSDELPDNVLDGIDVFYTDMSWPECSIFLARKCRELGIPVVFNLQNTPNEKTLEKAEHMEEMLGLCTLFITGRTTITETTGANDPIKGFREFTEGKSIEDGCILTLGTDGAVWFRDDGNLKCGIAKVSPVDTTGAGDAYIAGIMDSYYCRERSREESMVFGAELAALKCIQAGPRLMGGMDDMERLGVSKPEVREYNGSMKIRFLVETCLLSHGLRSISDSDMATAFAGIPAGFAWIESGKIRIGELETFMKFREKRATNRANKDSISDFCQSGADAALTASGTMEICRRNDIPLAVTCGMGGIGNIPGDRISSDLPALAEIPVPLLATSPKDMLDIGATIGWLRENGVSIFGYGSEYCTGYVFNSANEKLDGVFDENLSCLHGGQLLLDPIPSEDRIKDNTILQKAIEKAETAVREGQHYHPAANAELDRLTDGKTSRLQLEAVVRNARLAAELTKSL